MAPCRASRSSPSRARSSRRGTLAFESGTTIPPGAGESLGVRSGTADPATVVRELKTKPGKDIWLFGGGELFRVLLDAGLVDTVELAVMPVLLGEGIPVLPPGAQATLELRDLKRLSASGIVVLAYSVAGSSARAPRIPYVKA